MATPSVSPYTFSDLRSPRDVATNKRNIYNQLIANGFTSALSWGDLSVPSALVEIDADALVDFQLATKATLESGFNDWAVGDALTEHSRQIYGNGRRSGVKTIGRLLLTDTGNGPFTFDPSAVSFSVGKGGLVFDGVADPTGTVTGQLTLPLNGSVHVYVQASDVGAAFNVAVGTINTMVRGVLAGVAVTNPSDWLSTLGTVQGADVEQDVSLRARNRAQWATLGVGSPAPAYENWARAADVTITRVAVYTNLDMLDPGTVTVLIAGASGGLGASVVLAAQNNIAPGQIGGTKIPETARCVVASASNNTIPVIGNLYVQAEYNQPAFQAQVAANVLAYQQSLAIGAKVSFARLWEVILNIAGLDPGIITDADQTSPIADVVQAYYQVAVFDLTQLNFVSV